jgi:hypothetical protein
MFTELMQKIANLSRIGSPSIHGGSVAEKRYEEECKSTEKPLTSRAKTPPA